MRPKGNKGPEALCPFSDDAAQTVGRAIAAFCQNRKAEAAEILTTLTDDELDSAMSIAGRFSDRVWEAHGLKRDRAREAAGKPKYGVGSELTVLRNERMLGRALGFETTCKHPPELGWLTRMGTHCGAPGCGWGWSVEFFPEQYERVKALDPKIHCPSWRPGDDRTKFHSPLCLTKKSDREAQGRRAKFRAVP